MTQSADEILTLLEVAALLKVTTQTARRMAKRGELPGRQISKRGDWRFRRADVLAYLEPTRRSA